MNCIDCENVLVEYPNSQGQSLHCTECKKIFNTKYMKQFYGENMTVVMNAPDEVNHPQHYLSGKAQCSGCEKTIECIDVVKHMNFNLGNAVKYIWRSEHKGNRVQDLQKAIWYLQNEIDKK